MGESVNLGGLWKNKDSKGNTYLSGYLGNARLSVISNQFKKKDNEPDYVMLISAKDAKGAKEDGQAERKEEAPF